MHEYTVALTVVQTIEAETPQDAERIARHAVEYAVGLWWPGVTGDAKVEEVSR